MVCLVAVMVLSLLGACSKEGEYGSGDLSGISFSCDTLAFDTVFTQMGTTTQQVRVYNRGRTEVCLSEVTLQGGYASRFRLNVDGDTNMVAHNVRIAAGDSIFVFVRANINPNSSLTPFLVEDAIVFAIDGASGADRVVLTAYGHIAKAFYEEECRAGVCQSMVGNQAAGAVAHQWQF